MSTLLAAALACARRGWPVFPLAVGGKRPAVKDWESRATTDPARIRKCWGGAKAWNIGLATGPAGLVVVDLDRPKGGQQRFNPDGSIYTGAVGYDALAAEEGGESGFGETFTVATPSGGWHLYFACPEGLEARNTAGTLAYLVDTRARGGYVVAPGSRTDAGDYAAVHTGPAALLPAWLATRLAPIERPAAAPRAPVPAAARLARSERRTERLERYLTAAITRETTAVAAAAAGTRNHRLYCAAVALGQLTGSGYLTDAEATEPLTAAAHTAGLEALETARTIASGLTAGGRNPRTLALD